MRIDLPGCNLHECRYYMDGNCKDTNRYDGCMYRYYQAAYEKLLANGNYEDKRYPEVLGYCTLLVYDKCSNEMKEIFGTWNGKVFEGVDTDQYAVIAWKR